MAHDECDVGVPFAGSAFALEAVSILEFTCDRARRGERSASRSATTPQTGHPNALQKPPMQGSRVAAANRPGLKFPLRQLGMVSDACPKGVKHSTSRLQRLRDGRNTRVDGMNGIDRMPGVTEPGSIIQTASAEMCWILRSRQASLRTSWIANMSPVYGQRTALFFFCSSPVCRLGGGRGTAAASDSLLIAAPGIADTYSLRTFAEHDRWREPDGDAKAYESIDTWRTRRRASSI